MKLDKWICALVFLVATNSLFALTYKAVDTEGGEEHTIVKLTNNMVLACGDANDGQLGTAKSNTYILEFVLDGQQNTTSGYIENITAFDAGWLHSIAADSNGYCWAWGSDDKGELGDVDTSTNVDTPVQVNSGDQDPNNQNTFLQNIIGVAAGRSGEHSLVIEDASGRVLAFGNNHKGQLGCDSSYSTEIEPKYVHAITQDPNTPGVDYLENIIDVSAGAYHSMALDSSGHVCCFGDGSDGRLGNGSINPSRIPVQVLSGEQSDINSYLENIIAIDAGWSHCMALEAIDPNDNTKNGRVYCWGSNSGTYHGTDGYKLGNDDPDRISQSQPVLVHAGEQNLADPDASLRNIIAISAGESHGLALDKNGNVWAWGDSDYGQLGNGTTTDSRVPVKVKGGDQGGEYLESIVAIGAGYWHNIAIDVDGRVYTWGESRYGKLGTGKTSNELLPTLIDVPAASGGFDFSFSFTYENSVTALDPTDPNANDVTISISVTNPDVNDPNYIGDLSLVKLQLYLPAGLSYENIQIGGGGGGLDYTIDTNYNDERHLYTWPITSFPAGSTMTQTIDVYANKTAEPGTPLTCTARMDIGDAYQDKNFNVAIADWYEINNGVIYVDAGASNRFGKGTSWSYPYVRLQDAFERAARDPNNNNEVWIAKGYYYAPGNDNFKIPMGVEVYGGFEGVAEETTRSSRDFIQNKCRLYGYGCDYVVEVVDSYSSVTPVLDGVVVSAGKSAGVYLNGRDLDISSCVLTGNGYVNGSNGYGIKANSAAPEIVDCIISHNENDGVYLYGSNAVVKGSYIADNGADGVYASSSSTLDIVNSVIYGNAENGIYAANNNSNTVRNCTIASNMGRAVKSNSSNTQVSNCILWSNSDVTNTAKTRDERYQFENCSVTYSCINDPNDIDGTITGYDAATHNTQENPDLIYDNPNCVILFAIDSTSPCKDHGLNTSVQTGELDFYGSDRIYNTTVDMGAFEVNAQSSVSSIDYNSDAIINLIDFAPLKAAWQTSSGGANWNAKCDHDSDGTVELDDFKLLANNWLWEPYFLYNGTLTSKAHFDYLLRPLATADTLIPMEMSMMSMSLDSVSIDSVAGDDRETSSLESLSTLSTVESTEPEVILIEHVETPRKPAPEPTDLEKAHEIAQSLVWLDDLWYEGQIGDNITDEEWLMFRESIVDDIEALMEQ